MDWDREALRFARPLVEDGYYDEVDALQQETVGKVFSRAPRCKQILFVARLRALFGNVYGVEALIRAAS